MPLIVTVDKAGHITLDNKPVSLDEASDLMKKHMADNANAAVILQADKDTAQQALMFQAAKTYLDQRAYKRLNICHWSRSQRERSLYNTLARSGAAMFPFGCGAGGHVDGYETMLHRAIAPYELFVREGKKPFMALLRQSPFQSFIDEIQYQLEQGYLDIGTLAAREPRLGELNWLYRRWQDQGLVRYNGVLYELTDAGQFWQVNLTQTTLECMQYLLTGRTCRPCATAFAGLRTSASSCRKMRP